MADARKVFGVIPARLDSKRLPGKVLRDIAGKAMVHRVYENARRSPMLANLIIATDSEEVRQYCADHFIPVMMTGRHPSGTDRLYEVMERTEGDVYVNLQGDEPTLCPEHLDLILQPILTGQAEVSTLRVAIGAEAAQDPNVVKVVTDDKGRALYFSRFAIPFDRDRAGGVRYYKHIGIYAYTRTALSRFHGLPQSPLELAERLEQLRLLENGIAIQVAETTQDTVGVDTEADLQRVIAMFARD